MRFLLIITVSICTIFLADGPGSLSFETLVSRLPIVGSDGDNDCTIMVISGSATTDGRPILWKSRDVTRPDQKFRYISPQESYNGTTYGFNGNFYAEDSYRCYMGVNEVGFAIINANCYNLPDNRKDGLDDGDIMRLALEWCEDIKDWEELLAVTSIYGRKDGWMFGVMDVSGEAKLYECGNIDYTVYDANNPTDAPDGLIVRSVFGFSGWNTDRGLLRYRRARFLANNRISEQPFDINYILGTMVRDFSLTCHTESPYYPYPLPYYGHQGDLPVGFVNTDETINRYKTRSCSIIRGVLPDEDPKLATTYAMLGQPVLSLAIPLWVASQTVPSCLHSGNQAPWYSIIEDRMEELYPLGGDNSELYMDSHYLLDSTGAGIFSWAYDFENWGLDQAEQYLELWREHGYGLLDVRQAQDDISSVLWDGFSNNGDTLRYMDIAENNLPDKIGHYNYPNPFNASTTICFNTPAGTKTDRISVNIYTVLGARIANLGEVDIANGNGRVIWDGRDDSGNTVAAGIYFYKVEGPGYAETGKMLFLK
ncbi:MAG: T9SS type A sorting domain-containing protein [candidate division Zixibacteria bacterium]|nr:T9SS type A sorting domain-containing protein [candidate division Zixibacteria bacterium]